MNFYHSTACNSGVHCKACRDLLVGINFRDSVSRQYEVTGGREFGCPRNLPWKGKLPPENHMGPQTGTQYYRIKKQIESLPDDGKYKRIRNLLSRAEAKIKDVGPCTSCANVPMLKVIEYFNSKQDKWQALELDKD